VDLKRIAETLGIPENELDTYVEDEMDADNARDPAVWRLLSLYPLYINRVELHQG
jgi:hypothetical protein